MLPSFERSPQLYMRLAGLIYLAIIILGLFGETAARGSLYIVGDADATAAALTAAPMLWRSGIVADLLMQLCDIPVIVIFYLLFRPVHQGLNLTATYLNLIQTAVLVANKLTLIVPILLLSQAAYLSAFTTEQLNALSYLAINMHAYGFSVGLIFFGFACVIRGYLIYQSGYLPRLLGVLLAVAGLCYLVNSFVLLLAPTIQQWLMPGIFVPVLIAELSLSLWLIFKGVNTTQWSTRHHAIQHNN